MLIEKLGWKEKGEYVVLQAGIVAYLMGQSSIKAAQNFISEWSRRNSFPGSTIKYQLEIQYDNKQKTDDSAFSGTEGDMEIDESRPATPSSSEDSDKLPNMSLAGKNFSFSRLYG